MPRGIPQEQGNGMSKMDGMRAHWPIGGDAQNQDSASS